MDEKVNVFCLTIAKGDLGDYSGKVKSLSKISKLRRRRWGGRFLQGGLSMKREGEFVPKEDTGGKYSNRD